MIQERAISSTLLITMPRFTVFIPCTGSISVELEAENEDQAKEKALEAPWTMDKISTENGQALDGMTAHIYEWEMHKQITKGNAFYGVQNEIEVCMADFL
jgi:hypothetical protein